MTTARKNAKAQSFSEKIAQRTVAQNHSDELKGSLPGIEEIEAEFKEEEG